MPRTTQLAAKSELYHSLSNRRRRRKKGWGPRQRIFCEGPRWRGGSTSHNSARHHHCLPGPIPQTPCHHCAATPPPRPQHWRSNSILHLPNQLHHNNLNPPKQHPQIQIGELVTRREEPVT